MLSFTPAQFASYLKTIPDRVFVYDSRNQPDVHSSVLQTCRFDSAQLFLKPDALCFKNSYGSLCISNPRRITVDESEPAVGYILTVYSGHSIDGKYESVIVLLADLAQPNHCN